MVGGQIGSSAPCSQIPMMLYQKVLTGVFVGVVYQRPTCRFIAHCLQTWTERFILLHNLTSQEHRNSPDWCFGINWIHCLVSISWKVFINRKTGRIRAPSWYLIMINQSHNNKNDHLTRPREGQGLNGLNAWVLRYPTPRSSYKQLLLWKISSADNQDFLFADLRKKLNSLTSRFRQLNYRYV